MALFDQLVLFLCLNPGFNLTLAVKGTMASGIIHAARMKLCIVIWMGFVEVLRPFPFFFFIVLFLIGNFGFNVEELVKGALLS